MPAPLLVSLPHGFNASGVTMWALRLVNTLAAQGRACGLVVHDEPPGQRAIVAHLDRRVDIFDARGLPALDACNGDLEPFLPVYRLALGVLATREGAPVVCSPNLLGDSYGVFAALSRETPHLVRSIAVHHSDLPYNDLLCTHYAGQLSAFVGVSERIASRLRTLLPTRAADIYGIPYGVEVPEWVREREPLAGRPARLLYTGRMDHEQKRVGGLIAMSDALGDRGVPHELVLLGDGPASAELDTACASRPRIRRLPPVDPAGVAAALDAADLFVLGSRYEGLSVSLLEAVAHGAAPVITPSRSGTAQIVRHRQTGWIADATPECNETRAGAALADAVRQCLATGDGGLASIRQAGRRLVCDRYSAELCARRYSAVIDRAAESPPRPWPAHASPAFTGAGGGGSGTVPAGAQRSLADTLHALGATPIAVYGAGRHTRELASVFEESGTRIVAFLDDDPARQGPELWGVPIVPPHRARELGAEAIVVSSWLHQAEMAARCRPLGLPVHTLYPAGEAYHTHATATAGRAPSVMEASPPAPV